MSTSRLLRSISAGLVVMGGITYGVNKIKTSKNMNLPPNAELNTNNKDLCLDANLGKIKREELFSSKLYVVSNWNMSNLTIDHMKQGFQYNYLSLLNAFENAKYFTTKEAATNYKSGKYGNPNLSELCDRIIILSVEVDCELDSSGEYKFPVKMIHDIEFPEFGQSITINSSPVELLNACNAMRNPECQVLFELNNAFICTKEKFIGDYSALSSKTNDVSVTELQTDDPLTYRL